MPPTRACRARERLSLVFAARQLRRAAPRRRTAPPRASGEALRSWPPAEVWADVLLAHEGEWESASAAFGPEGALLPLPPRFVPPEYKEWGQTVHEWRGRVRVAAAAAEAQAGGVRAGRHRLTSTLERFWPTVGCEFGKVRASLWPARAP